jgi:hypothetical protein
MMGQQAGRRDDDWLPKVLVGLSVAASIARSMRNQRGRRHWQPPRQQRQPVSPFGVLFVLVGLFIAFIIVMSILGGFLSALSSAGGGVLCLAPLAIMAFALWAVRKGSTSGGQARDIYAGDTWTDGRGQSVQDMTLDSGRTAAGPATAPQTGEPLRRTAPAAQPRRVAAIDPYPEKNATSPAEYRQRAVSYRRRIQSVIKSRRPGPLAVRLASVPESLKSWEERVGQLADRLSLFENDDLIRRDIKEVPARIARLERLIELEVDPEIRRQMTKTLAAYREQQRQLDRLGRVMRRTRLNLDDTLAAMGTIYSQVQVVNAMDVDGATAERIAGEIDSEVNRLNDLLSAVSEVNQATVNDPTAVSTDEVVETGEDNLAARRARLQRSARQ